MSIFGTIGNDIVDLTEVANFGKSRSKRFLERVFTKEEQRLIEGSEWPDRILWLLWAAKEATYKVLVKMVPEVTFVPRNYPIERLQFEGYDAGYSDVLGSVHHNGIRVPFLGEMSESFVHVCAIYPHLSFPVYREIFPCSERHSEEIRKRLARRIGELFSIGEEEVHVIRDKTTRGLGHPYVVVAGHVGKVDVSLSHDYTFAAYAICY
ncbi:MAG: 4'-phosphopantetheinyl transferase superfamily protein [Syntrophales bacterium]|nr:4'-phosphopantetheinyl transferase superfamily protein [Syntrophales bacterium]